MGLESGGLQLWGLQKHVQDAGTSYTGDPLLLLYVSCHVLQVC